MGINNMSKKKLHTWLQKSLANHPENENGLVAYVEAIVGDAEGTDEDLREKWTDKLDDFLADSSSDFANLLLRGVRTGTFGQIWRGGGGGGGDEDVNDGGGYTMPDSQAEEASHDRTDEPDQEVEDAVDAGDADSWDDDNGRGRGGSNDDEDDDEEDDEDGRRSRRNRRRMREEEEPTPESAAPEKVDGGYSTGNAGGDGGGSASKRQRVQGGRGAGGGNRSGSGGNDGGGRGGRGGGGQQGSKKGTGRGGSGMGSLAPMGQQHQQGRGPGPAPGQWGGGINGGRSGARGMPPGGFGPPGYPGPGGFMGGPPRPMGPGQGPMPVIPGGPPMHGGGPPGVFNGAPPPRGPVGLLPSPPTSSAGAFIGQPGGGRGGALLPGPPVMDGGGVMGQSRGMPLLGPHPGGQQIGPGGPVGPGRPLDPEGSIGSGGPRGPRGPVISSGPRGPGGGIAQGGPRGPGGKVGPRGLVGPGGPGESNGGQGDRGMPIGMSGPTGGPIVGGRGGRPLMDRPPQGHSPGIGPRPAPHVFAGSGGPRRPGGPMGREGNGAGVARTGQQQNQDGRQNTHDGQLGILQGSEAFDTRGMQPGHGRGQGQGPSVRPVVESRLGPENRPGADMRRGPGIEGSAVQGSEPRPGMDMRDRPGMRPAPDSRPGPDMPQGSDRQGAGLRQDLHQGRDGRDRQGGIRLGQDMRQSPDPREGLGVRHGPTGMRDSSSNNNLNDDSRGKQNGRSVFERLGAPPGQEGGGGHERMNTLDGRGHSPNTRHGQDADQNQAPMDARHGPNVRAPGMQQRQQQQQGIPQQGRNDPRGQDVQRNSGANVPERQNLRHGQDGRSGPDEWSGPRPEGRQGQGPPVNRMDQGMGPERGLPPGVGGDFNRGDTRHGMGPGAPGPRGGRGIPREYSPNGPRPQQAPMHANSGHGRAGGGGGSQSQLTPRPATGTSSPHNHQQPQVGPSGQGTGTLAPLPHVGGMVASQQAIASRPGMGTGVPPAARNQLNSGPRGMGYAHGQTQPRGTAAGGDGVGGAPQIGAAAGSGGGGGALAWGGFGVVRDQGNHVGGGVGSGAGYSRGQQQHQQRRAEPSAAGAPGFRGGGGGGRGSQVQGGQGLAVTTQHGFGRGDTPGHGNSAAASTWRNAGANPAGGSNEKRYGSGRVGASGGGRGPLAASEKVTVRVNMIPGDVGINELRPHFLAFGELVDFRIRTVLPEEGGQGEKEALVQFASARQAQACVSSPKAVLDNRFIVVASSPVNLVDVDHSYVDPGERAVAAAAARAEAANAAKMEEEANAAAIAKAEAAAAFAAKKAAHEKVIAQASKTREVVAQQRLLVLLRERIKVASEQLTATREKRNKVQGFLKMMEDKGKPEAEKARYRAIFESLSAKVVVLEAAAEVSEVEQQARKLADLETEARDMGATVPPPPNASMLAKLMGGAGGRGSGADATSGGRGYGRGRSHAAAAAGASSTAAAGTGTDQPPPRVVFSLDNRPTTVKVAGLPPSAGEGDLRVHANMAGVVVAAAMLGRPGEGVVKFVDRRTAELFMAKSKSFGGIPLTMTWYTAPFPEPEPEPARTVPVPVTFQRTFQGAPLQPPSSVSSASSTAARASPSTVPTTRVASTTVGHANSSDLRHLIVKAYSQKGFDSGSGGRGGGGWGGEMGDGNIPDDGGNGSGGRGSAGSSPLRLPATEGDEEEDEMYQDMGGGGGGDGVGDVAGGGSWM